MTPADARAIHETWREWCGATRERLETPRTVLSGRGWARWFLRDVLQGMLGWTG